MTSEIERFQKSEVEERGECLPKALALLSGGCVKTTRKGSRYFHGRAFINRREHARPLSCGEKFFTTTKLPYDIAPYFLLCRTDKHESRGVLLSKVSY